MGVALGLEMRGSCNGSLKKCYGKSLLSWPSRDLIQELPGSLDMNKHYSYNLKPTDVRDKRLLIITSLILRRQENWYNVP